MSRKLWILAALAFLVIAALGVGAIFGPMYYKEHIIKKMYASGLEDYGNEYWGGAKDKLGRYLSRHPDDVETLRKYANACTQILKNRDVMLAAACKAYYQIALTDPQDTTALDKLFELLRQRRAWGDMEYYAGLFLKKKPDDQDLLLYRAVALQSLQRHDEAKKIYQKLVDAGTDNAEAYGGLAWLMRRDDDDRGAEDVFKKALEAHSDNVGLWIELAQFHLAKVSKTDKEAALALGRALLLAPDDLDVLVMGVRVAIASEQWPKAVELALKAVEVGPDEADAHLALIMAYQSEGSNEKALKVLNDMTPQIRADYPEFFSAHIELLLLMQKLDDIKPVMDEYKSTYPRHVMMFDYLAAREELARGNAANAARKLTVFVQTYPSFKQGHYYLTLAYLRTHQRERARGVLEMFLANHPGDVQAKALFEGEFGKGSSLTALAKASRELINTPGTAPEILAKTAVALAKAASRHPQGKAEFQTVNELLEKAIRLKPALVSAHSFLIEMLVAQGEADKAAAALERAEKQSAFDKNFNRTRACVALIQDDVDRVETLFDNTLEDNDMTQDNVIAWANLSAARGHLETGLSMFDKAAQRAEAASADTLRIEQVSLCLRNGASARASELVASLEAQPGNSTELAVALRDVKVQLVQTLLRSAQAEDEAVAQRILGELRRDDPGDAQIQLMQAKMLLTTDPPDHAAARAMALPILDSNPSHTKALSFLADLAFRENDLLAAADFAERAVASGPNDLEPLLILAHLQMLELSYEEAIANLERVLAQNSEVPRALELLTEAYLATKRFQQAQDVLGRWEAMAAKTGAAPRRIAVLRSRLLVARDGNIDEAESVLRKRYESNPDDGETVSELALVLAGQLRKSEAEQLLRTFAEAHDDLASAWVRLAHFYLVDGEESAAKASSALVRALLIEPDYPPALRDFAQLYLLTGKKREALGMCEQYLNARPGDHEILYQKAALLMTTGGNHEEALNAVQRALSAKEQPEYIYLRGEIRLVLKQYSEALRDLQDVSSLSGQRTTEMNLALAEAYLGLKDTAMASICLQTVETRLDDTKTANVARFERLTASLKDMGEKP